VTFHTHRSDRSNQSPQNAIWTSPLLRSCRDNLNAYVERPVRSPDEGVMVLARTSPVPDQSDWSALTVWPVLAVKFELGVVLWHEICIDTDSYWGKTSPPYIYEGARPIEGNTIKSIYYFYFSSSQQLFQPPCVGLKTFPEEGLTTMESEIQENKEHWRQNEELNIDQVWWNSTAEPSPHFLPDGLLL
jgi:hypothetical protein